MKLEFVPQRYGFGLGTVKVSFTEAKAANPFNILEQAMNVSEFGGVPVLIVDPDHTPKDLNGFEAYMMDRLGGEAQTPLAASFKFYEDELRGSLQQESILGFVPPCAALYPVEPKIADSIEAAIILAPGSACTPELDLLYGLEAERHNPAPLLNDNQSWRYYELFHELAHVAGAREPQADHIANIFCRRAFPDAATPWIQSDIRAMEAVALAAKLAAGRSEDPADTIDSIEKYGWPMVVANDCVNALPQADVAGLSEEDILARHTAPYIQNSDRLFQLGVLIREAGLSEQILSGKTEEIMRGARKLERRITALTDDTEIRHIAGRFSLAARRIHTGAAAYVNPAKPLLFTAPAV